MSAGASAVLLDGLRRSFDTTEAVRGVSLAVERGETVGLIGPDGAGKTTTLRIALGLLRPSAGTVRTLGLDPARRRRALARKVGYQAQRFSLYGDLSVDENVAFFAAVHGVRDWRPRRDELLELLRLTPFRARLAERLSGGMRQKLALVCTLIHRPELLVLDEPTTGVDPVSRRDFWRVLARLQREGLTILLTTPYLDEAERCRRVALMSGGRLLAADTPERLRATFAGALLELIARPQARAAALLRARAGIRDVETFGERLHVALATGGPASAVADALVADLRREGVEVSAVRAIAPSLEDVFIERIRGALERPAPAAEVPS